MIDLLKLHWQFIRRPSEALDEHIPVWPLEYGIVLYLISYGGAMIQSGKSLTVISDFVSDFWGLSGPLFVYLFILANLSIGAAVQYYLQPQFVRRIAGMAKETFDANLLRKIIFFSPTANAIILVILILPLQIISSVLRQFPSMSMLTLVFIVLVGVVSIWLVVSSVNTFVVQWKGLAKFFKLNAGQIILAEFVIPLVLALPLILLYGSRYLTFMQKYLR